MSSDIFYPSMLLCKLTLPEEYHSLLARLNSIYGSSLTVESLLQISDADFLAHQGVGKTYIDRFQALKKILFEHYYDDKSQISFEDITSEDILLSQVLFKKIKECFPHINSYNDINNISPDEFVLYPGVGKKKVQELIKWQSKLISNEPINQEEDNVIKELEDYRFSFLYLSQEEEKLLKKLQNSKIFTNAITPSYIYSLSQYEIKSCKGFGSSSCNALYSFQRKIFESFKDNNPQSILIHDQFDKALALKELGLLIKEDLENFHNILSGNNDIVWCSRSGYQTEQLTLQEIGDKISITRERVRQIEKKLNSKFVNCVRVRPNIIKAKIENKTRVELLNDLKQLRMVFNTDNDLIRMLALITNEDSRGLLLKFNPPIKSHVLDSFFLWHQYPAKRHEISIFLHEEIGGSEQEIDIYLSALVNASIIRTQGEQIIPIELSKELAIAHILSGYPKGLSWKNIALKVNKSGICHTNLSMERPDPNLNFSSYFFQSGQHTYSHVRFMSIGKKQIDEIIEKVKLSVQYSQYNSLHLMTEYYAKLESPQYGYYTIRYAIRNFGELYGLFFNGKSQSDTVSLHPISKTISQKEAIKRLFIENDSPQSVQEITKHIKSQSESHARLYLDELVNSGDLVATEVNQYQFREKAFRGIDIKSIKEIIRTMITEDRRLHHISIIGHHLNRIYGYDNSNRFWRSFVSAYAEEMGWFVKGMFISIDKIRIKGLSELVQLNQGKVQEDIIAAIQKEVCVSRDEIKRAIYNEEIKSQDTTVCNSEAQGLASDVIDELFLL